MFQEIIIDQNNKQQQQKKSGNSGSNLGLISLIDTILLFGVQDNDMAQNQTSLLKFRVRFFGKIRIRIFDPISLGSWCIKGQIHSG